MAQESENLNRWRQTGEPQRWVAAHACRWDHQDWLELLEVLQRSAYWPMHETDIGMTLEVAREEMNGDSAEESAVGLRMSGITAKRRRRRTTYSQADDEILERAAKAEVEKLLGRSEVIRAATLAEAVAEAERLKGTHDLMVGINSLWSWYCDLPADQRDAIGQFAGNHAKHRLWSSARFKMRRT